MKEYKNYTIQISLKSPIVTPLQSDTIFGHICWAIRFLKWEISDKLKDFLSCYENNEYPPLLVSNGFPEGYIPKPILPPVTQRQLDDIIGKTNRIKNSFIIKTIKNIGIIPKEDFLQLQNGCKLTSEKLFNAMYSRFEVILEKSRKIQPMVVQHNTVNRLKGKVTTGLYSQEEFFLDFSDKDSTSFEIYIKTDYFALKDLQRIFEFIKEQGFGRDKSTGKGHFTIEGIKEGIDLPEPEIQNAFMTLSSYIPREKDPTKGYYHILLKYGKLGSLYSKGSLEVKRNPFKKPLIMFSAGSTFYDSNYQRGKIYGSLLKDIHHNENIRHYAYAFPMGIHL